MTNKKYQIKSLTDSPAYSIGLYPYELTENGKQIETDSNWDSPNYLIALKKILEKGGKLNWWNKLKSRILK